MWLDCPGRSKNCSRICESQTLLKLWLEAKHVSERTVWFCTRTSPEAAHKTCEELLWGFGSKGTWSFISRKGSVRFFGKRGLRGNKGYLYYIKRSFDTKILENNGIYVWGTREGKWNFQGIKETCNFPPSYSIETLAWVIYMRKHPASNTGTLPPTLPPPPPDS